MHKQLISILIVLLVLSSFALAGEITLGGEITIDTATKISEVLDNPTNFMDKPVRVEGIIVDGCKHQGTWIALASDKEFQKLNVWDKEGKIKFPLEHKGKYAIVQGTLYTVHLTEEQATKWLQHLAETHEQEVDLSKAKGGMDIYRLSPTAAIVKDSQ